jgi:hypothetical protein
MSALNVILIGFIIVLLAATILLFLKLRSKSSFVWDKVAFNKNPRLYLDKLYTSLEVHEENKEQLLNAIEILRFLKQLSSARGKDYNEILDSEFYSNSKENIISLLAPFLKEDSKKEELLDSLLITTEVNTRLSTFIKSLEEKTDIRIEEETELLADAFMLLFLIRDYFEYVQNKDWAKQDAIDGLRFAIGTLETTKEFKGSGNSLEYNKALINAHKILISKNIDLNKNLILGFKIT